MTLPGRDKRARLILTDCLPVMLQHVVVLEAVNSTKHKTSSHQARGGRAPPCPPVKTLNCCTYQSTSLNQMCWKLNNMYVTFVCCTSVFMPRSGSHWMCLVCFRSREVRGGRWKPLVVTLYPFLKVLSLLASRECSRSY